MKKTYKSLKSPNSPHRYTVNVGDEVKEYIERKADEIGVKPVIFIRMELFKNMRAEQAEKANERK